MKPTIDAYQLLHDGSLALSQIEANGIAIDTDYLARVTDKISRKISNLQEELKSDEVWRTWKKEYGGKANLGSLPQMAHVIFEVMGHPCKSYTPGSYNADGTLKEKRRPKADEEAFQDVDLEFCRNYSKLQKLQKTKNTYLKGISRETVDGFIHPFFNLHTVSTYRSSSDRPNFQNIPIRDAYQGKTVRRCFIPRPGRVLVENDFGALEFRIYACVFQDPKMIAYASDPEKDIHRDMAAKCFRIKRDKVNKDSRYVGKNGFVFPKLYGSYYAKIAKAMWLAIDQKNLEVDGVPMKKHLASKGITELGACDPKEEPKDGTFEKHIYGVERWFENEFPTLMEVTDKWYNDYRKACAFQMVTGFVEKGLYSRNDTLNHPVQGPGFHCLLWCLIRVLEILRERRMESLLVGQIHDCLLGDVLLGELQEYLDIVQHVVEVELPRAWPWLIVPMIIEAEVTPEGGSWHDKEAWVKVNGVWGPKKKAA